VSEARCAWGCRRRRGVQRRRARLNALAAKRRRRGRLPSTFRPPCRRRRSPPPRMRAPVRVAKCAETGMGGVVTGRRGSVGRQASVGAGTLSTSQPAKTDLRLFMPGILAQLPPRPPKPLLCQRWWQRVPPGSCRHAVPVPPARAVRPQSGKRCALLKVRWQRLQPRGGVRAGRPPPAKEGGERRQAGRRWWYVPAYACGVVKWGA